MLDDTGAPTQRYFNYLDQTQSGAVLAEGIRDAYGDLFAINKNANELDVDEVKNKLRTLTQGQKSDKVVGLMASTFKALSDQAEWKAGITVSEVHDRSPQTLTATEKEEKAVGTKDGDHKHSRLSGGIHYNIQIHLPESRDTAVFDAIFRSLREHLL